MYYVRVHLITFFNMRLFEHVIKAVITVCYIRLDHIDQKLRVATVVIGD